MLVLPNIDSRRDLPHRGGDLADFSWIFELLTGDRRGRLQQWSHLHRRLLLGPGGRGTQKLDDEPSERQSHPHRGLPELELHGQNCENTIPPKFSRSRSTQKDFHAQCLIQIERR
jgi:hypothetical protein